MAEDNVVLENLRAIRNKLDRIEDTLIDHGRRMTGLEQGQADIQRFL